MNAKLCPGNRIVASRSLVARVMAGYVFYMKTHLAAVALLMTGASGALAQEFVAPKPQKAPPIVHPVKLKPTIEGVVTEIFTVKKPWQLVSPLAPKSYGDGRQNVTYSEKEPGKPKGIILFAFEW
jgi:hypothetical protein